MMIHFTQTDDEDDRSSSQRIQITEYDSSSQNQTPKKTLKWRLRKLLEQCFIFSPSLMIATLLALLTVVWINSDDNSHFLPRVEPYNTRVQTSQQKNNANDEKQHLDETFISTAPGACVNKYCIFAASDILKSLDMTIDPCEDFYGFACNQWIRENPLPHGRFAWSALGKLEMRNKLIMKNILEKPFSYFKSEAEKKAKLYYQSCMDEDENIEKLGGDPMLDFIIDVGGWNISTVGFRIDEWSMEHAMKKMQNKYNVGGYVSWTIREDNHAIQIYRRSLALPTREHYLKTSLIHEKVRTTYLEYMIKTGVLLGGEEFAVKRQMRDVLEFETKIAGIKAKPEGLQNGEAVCNFWPLRDVDALIPFMNFTSHFEDALETIGRKITQGQQVTVCEPEFLKSLSALVLEYQKTERGRIALNNYLVWQGVRTLTSWLSKPFRDANKGVRKALLGSDRTEETWRYCVGDTNNVIGFPVGAIFVRETFDDDAKPQAQKMINEVRDAFKKNLRNIKWLDTKTRKKAEEISDSITDMIGFPKYILNSTQLDEKYKDLQLNATEYFNNNLRIKQFDLKTILEKWDTPVKKNDWTFTPSTVNAHYMRSTNQIIIPAGILRNPFFDVHNPKSLNYGSMGVVMGHELIHALDALNKWLEPKSTARIFEQAECIIKQYGKFQEVGMNIKGEQTLRENIADNGGLRAAFNAYINSKSEKEADYLSLPGLNFTHRQLFFISFAQGWCSAFTDEAATLQIEKSPHAPAKFRIIGTLSNSREFSKEFNCPVGSRMNPRQKCQIW